VATAPPDLKSVLDGSAPAVSPNFTLPSHQIPEVRDALAKMWQSTSNGTTGAESSVVLHGLKADGSPIMRVPPNTNQHDSETFSIAPGDKALYHVHPEHTDPKPSDADMKIADRYGIDMYSLSSQGLYKYSKGMKAPQLVESGLDWLSKR
jgi:hypothetical protein